MQSEQLLLIMSFIVRKNQLKVIAKKADYLFIVKDNNTNLKSNIELYIKNEKADKYITSEKNNGKFEKRMAYTSNNTDQLPNKDDWANLKTIGAIHTEFEKSRKKTEQ